MKIVSRGDAFRVVSCKKDSWLSYIQKELVKPLWPLEVTIEW